MYVGISAVPAKEYAYRFINNVGRKLNYQNKTIRITESNHESLPNSSFSISNRNSFGNDSIIDENLITSSPLYEV
jgi:hypothetical protein